MPAKLPIGETRDADEDAFSDQDTDLNAVDPYMGFSRCLVVLLRRVMGLLTLKSDDGYALSRVGLELQSMYVLTFHGLL